MKPGDFPSVDIRTGDALSVLKEMPSESVQMCCTSPPYFGLRKYGDDPSEIGQEKTPEEYISGLVTVFEEVRRVLKSDGTLWLNIGDSYCSGSTGSMGDKCTITGGLRNQMESAKRPSKICAGYKVKDLIGIPWLLAFALRAAGWYLRCDIVWAKLNCMPESVEDRPTRSHEFVFLFSKNGGNPLIWKSRDTKEWSKNPDLSEKIEGLNGELISRWKGFDYYYDHEAIKDPCIWDVDGIGTASRKARANEDLKSFPYDKRAGIRNGGFKDGSKMNRANGDKQRGHSRKHAGFNDRWDAMPKEEQCTGMRNKRDVWTIAPAQYHDAHFATMPTDLVKPCVLAGSRPGDTVLDPFGGSGCVGEVALEYGRSAILIDLYEKHAKMAQERTSITPGLSL